MEVNLGEGLLVVRVARGEHQLVRSRHLRGPPPCRSGLDEATGIASRSAAQGAGRKPGAVPA